MTMDYPTDFLWMMAEELDIAKQQNEPLNSHHEAFAVIMEELDEYWDQVRLKPSRRNPEQMRDKLVQCATMCWRAALDLKLTTH